MSTLLRVGIMVAAVTWTGRAWAGEDPPPNDQWDGTRDYAELAAYNVISTPQGDQLTLWTDRGGRYNWWFAGNWQGSYIDVYSVDYSGAEYPNALRFDIWEWLDSGDHNHFQGYSSYYQSPLPNGHTFTHWEGTVNGVFHGVDAETDANGNVVTSYLAKHSARRDPCKVIADWGAVQCPRDLLGGPKQIPAKVQSIIRSVGWFSDAWHAVADKVEDAAAYVVTKIRDPRVQIGLIVVGTILLDAACCWASAGTACVLCIVGSTTIGTASIGGVVGSSTHETDEARSGNLRSHGYINCEQPECLRPTQTICTDPIEPC